MGGIVIRREPPETNPEEEKSQSHEAANEKEPANEDDWTNVVSPLDSLAHPDLSLTIDDADIRDKSHSDAITKLLAIV
ncbi:hypothetical protein B0H67DRAFT_645166 [Lasiosphaeris hirsuta]|uniref:Uncharacterized protein n=1 Tax=Lasiosphaeris hirsuta TaxID=260670 RepID=A0AA40AGH5_9PEZI|nr:hypothetical protein B0H67DRAFT_645166 [Lasiosphaeris hirsuta]